MPLEKDKLGLILLGASKFPHSTRFTSSEAFLHSKERIKSFFSKNVFLQEGHDCILDLFDMDYDPNRIDSEINTFIEARKERITDLIIYYVGHGGYDNQNGFLLTINQSKDDNLAVSSITAQVLGRRLSRAGNKFRLFLILDCCFAGQLYSQFQSSSLIDVIQRDIAESFPENGIALLCSSSKDRPSIIVKERSITMFSEGLETAFRKGNPNVKNEYLTLRELSNLTYSFIKEYNIGEQVRPEVHTLKMPNGDIADIPHFFNNAYKPDGITIAYDIDVRKKNIEATIMANNLLNASMLFIDFINDFDRTHKYKIDMPILVSECNGLEEDKPASKEHPSYKQYKADRMVLYKKILEIINEIKNDNPA